MERIDYRITVFMFRTIVVSNNLLCLLNRSLSSLLRIEYFIICFVWRGCLFVCVINYYIQLLMEGCLQQML